MKSSPSNRTPPKVDPSEAVLPVNGSVDPQLVIRYRDKREGNLVREGEF